MLKTQLVVCAIIVGTCDAIQHTSVAFEPLNHSRPDHFWPNSRGALSGQQGNTNYTVPPGLFHRLAWKWDHPKGKYHTVTAGGPVIDRNKNLYLTTADGIWKINEFGKTIWNHPLPQDSINNMPALMGNALYLAKKNGHAEAVDIDTGKTLWDKQFGRDAGFDSGYPSVYNNLFVFGVDMGHHPSMEGGNMRVIAANAATGNKMWEFRTEIPVWNLMPLFPGDDSVVFMDFTGGIYKVGLHNGSKIWHTRSPNTENSFSDGGAALGGNGKVYTCSNPGKDMGMEGSKGALRAFNLTDGKMIWERILPQACNSYPAIGRLKGRSKLSVVATVGNFPGTTSIHGGIMTFDADTGAPLWQFQAPVYHSLTTMAAGDAEGVFFRAGKSKICLPAHWSCPTITGDGEIIAGRLDGQLYRVRGPANGGSASPQSFATLSNINFATTAGVHVETFFAGGAFLHGAMAFAPKMMAAATCTDSLYAFKY